MIGLLLALGLFDGQTLAGWIAEGDADWRVEAAAIVAAGEGQGFLVSEREFTDFRLTRSIPVYSSVVGTAPVYTRTPAMSSTSGTPIRARKRGQAPSCSNSCPRSNESRPWGAGTP